MALIGRRDVLRALSASGMALSPLGRNAGALECNKPDPEHIIIGKQTSGVSGFDPHLNGSALAAEVIGNLYETLVTLKGGKPDKELSLATWAEPNGAVWTFAIKPGRRFASRNPITAADAAFSLKRALRVNSSPTHPLTHLGLTRVNADRYIKADKNNAYVLTIGLPEAIEKDIVLHCLTSASCSILDSQLVQQRRTVTPIIPATCRYAPLDPATCRYAPLVGTSDPGLSASDACQYDPLDTGEAWLRFNSAGSGPFLIRNAERTDEILLQRNVCHPDYVKSSKPLILRDVADPRKQQRLLQCGEIQVAWNTPLEPVAVGAPKAHVPKNSSAKWAKPSTNSAFGQARHAKANLLLLCMNVTKDPLTNPEIRKGIRQGIDIGALETPRWTAQPRFFPSEIGGFNIEIPASYDLEKARKALANQKCSLKLDYLIGAGRSTVANGLAWQLAAAGISLKLDPASSGHIFQERLEKRGFDLALVSFSSDYLHPHGNAHALCTNSDWEELNPVAGPRTLAWYCHLRDDVLMKRIADAAKASGPATQLVHYKAIQADLFERGSYAFLLEETAHVKGVNGLLPLLGALDNQTRYSPPKPT